MRRRDQKIHQTIIAIYELLERRLPLEPDESARGTGIFTEELAYDEERLMTVKQAAFELGVSRWKIHDMRTKGELTSIKKNGQVRLIKTEIEAAKLWYSVPKGKC